MSSWPAPCLDGIRILDLSRLLPGPYATWLLGAMGADVLRVESPGLGDYARWMPPMLGPVSAMFHVINRGKRSIVVDLKTDAGREIVLKLVAGSDVVFEQFRPGVLDRLGIGYDVLRGVKPDVILCSLTGYGQTGPMAQAAGHDMNYQALAGVLALQGSRGGPPALSTPPMADLVGAQTAVTAVVGALFRRLRTGEGAWLDVSMTDSVAGFAAPFVAALNALVDAGEPEPPRGDGLLSGGLAQYNVYECRDGGWLAVGALEPKFFARFAAVCEHPEWMQIPALPNPLQRQLRADIAAVVAGRTQQDWEQALAGVDCCVTVVRQPAQTPHEPQLQARGLLRQGPPGLESVGWADTPLGPPIQGAPPGVGQHTDEVLAALGLDPEAIRAMRASGVVE